MDKLKLLSLGIMTITLAGVALLSIPKKQDHTHVYILSEGISHSEFKEKYEEWKTQYSQKSKIILLGDSESSETFRFENFKQNLQKISDHNKKYLSGDHSFTMKLN